MKTRLVECTDHKYSYGILSVDNVSVFELQKEIDSIKAELREEGIEDWTIQDVIERFPEEWNCYFDDNVPDVEI